MMKPRGAFQTTQKLSNQACPYILYSIVFDKYYTPKHLKVPVLVFSVRKMGLILRSIERMPQVYAPAVTQI
jgi:hypothetical protein